MTRTHQFAEALSDPAVDEADAELQAELKRALSAAENALMQAKLALAVGDVDAANSALELAGEAHGLAQRIRSGTLKRSAA